MAGQVPGLSAGQAGITVQVSAQVAAPVDTVVVRLGVESLRPDAGEAFAATADTVTQVLSILADAGIDARNVRTAELTFGPRTTWQNEREVLLGYAASQRLVVTMTDLGGIERLLGAVVAGGGAGVRIDDVSLTADRVADALQQARQEAMTEAKLKAEHYASLAGRALGGVLSIDEIPGGGGGGPVMRSAMFSSDQAAKMPVALGDQNVSVSLTVCWAFAD